MYGSVTILKMSDYQIVLISTEGIQKSTNWAVEFDYKLLLASPDLAVGPFKLLS